MTICFVCAASEPLHCCRARVRVWALESRLLYCGPLLQPGPDYPLGPQDDCPHQSGTSVEGLHQETNLQMKKLRIQKIWPGLLFLCCFHQGLLSGLCGNFDSVTVNDMTTSSHIEVNNAQTFGDSWALGQVFVSTPLILPLLSFLFFYVFVYHPLTVSVLFGSLLFP